MQAENVVGVSIVLRYADRDSDLAAIAKQRLVEAGVQVFDRKERSDSSRAVDRTTSNRDGADLRLTLSATVAERDRWEDFILAEGEAMLTLVRSGSDEVLCSEIQRANGRRTSIRDAALGSARHEAFARALDRIIGRIVEDRRVPIVRDAVIVNVFSEKALLAIMEYLAKLDGVREVRRLSFNRTTNEAHIELVGVPGIEAFWRAYLEDMPKTLVESRETDSSGGAGFPTWLPLAVKE